MPEAAPEAKRAKGRMDLRPLRPAARPPAALDLARLEPLGGDRPRQFGAEAHLPVRRVRPRPAEAEGQGFRLHAGVVQAGADGHVGVAVAIDVAAGTRLVRESLRHRVDGRRASP